MSQVRVVKLMARMWAAVAGGFEWLQGQQLWGGSTHLLGWFCVFLLWGKGWDETDCSRLCSELYSNLLLLMPSWFAHGQRYL
jgi:hypothetical protein